MAFGVLAAVLGAVGAQKLANLLSVLPRDFRGLVLFVVLSDAVVFVFSQSSNGGGILQNLFVIFNDETVALRTLGH